MLERHTCNNFSSGKSNAKDIMIRKRQELHRLIIIHQTTNQKNVRTLLSSEYPGLHAPTQTDDKLLFSLRK